MGTQLSPSVTKTEKGEPMKAKTILPVGLVMLVSCAPGWAQEKGAAAPGKEVALILKRTNAERARQDLPPLKLNSLLTRAAQRHTENMARQGRMAHELDGQTPADRVRKVGYEFTRLGENVAYGMPVQDVVSVWMKSPGHKSNILGKDYTEIGIGVARDEDGVPYYTQVFGRPARGADD